MTSENVIPDDATCRTPSRPKWEASGGDGRQLRARTTRRAAASVSIACIALATAAPALGQGSRSDGLFYEGRALMAQGRVAEACEKFEESVALVRRGGALLNLATCTEDKGHYATALRLLTEARDLALKADRADRVAFADAHIADVRTRLSWLTVTLGPGAPSTGLAIMCDGESLERSSWGAPMAVDPGVHTVVATAPGRAAFKTTLAVGPAGDRQTVEIPFLDEERIEPARPAPAVAIGEVVPAAPAVAPAPARRTVGWASAGVGVASLLVGGAAGVAAIVDSRASDSQCLDGICSVAGYRANQQARVAAVLADVTLPLGLVASSAGLYLLLAQARFASPSAPSVSRGFVTVSPGGARIGLEAAW